MITEAERQRLADVQESLNRVPDMLREAIADFDELQLPEGFFELSIGTMLAAIDAIFAIREGTEWRGLSDPQQIARKLLKEAHLGEFEEIES